MSSAADGGGRYEGRPWPADRPRPAPVPGGGVRASSSPGRGVRLSAAGLMVSLAAVVLMALVFIGDALALLAWVLLVIAAISALNDFFT